jgi:hypothetical protein
MSAATHNYCSASSLGREGAALDLSVHQEQVGFDVFTAVTMKNALFWDIKTLVSTS